MLVTRELTAPWKSSATVNWGGLQKKQTHTGLEQLEGK